jgi:hypothetical protein
MLIRTTIALYALAAAVVVVLHALVTLQRSHD